VSQPIPASAFDTRVVSAGRTSVPVYRVATGSVPVCSNPQAKTGLGRIPPTPHVITPHVITPRVTALRVTSVRATAPRVTAPRTTAPRVTGMRATGPGITGPRVTGPWVSGRRAADG
jgi:hypothetical protein